MLLWWFSFKKILWLTCMCSSGDAHLGRSWDAEFLRGFFIVFRQQHGRRSIPMTLTPSPTLSSAGRSHQIAHRRHLGKPSTHRGGGRGGGEMDFDLYLSLFSRDKWENRGPAKLRNKGLEYLPSPRKFLSAKKTTMVCFFFFCLI